MNPTEKALQLSRSFGFLREPEVHFLQELAGMLPRFPKVVNVGAGAGTSALALYGSRDDLTVISVDIQDAGSPFGSLEGERNAFGDIGIKLNNRWMQICGDSVSVGNAWDKGEVDMVFVDGAHEYEKALDDIGTWASHIRNEGIIAVHDYDGEHWPGVLQACNAFFDKDPFKVVENLAAWRQE